MPRTQGTWRGGARAPGFLLPSPCPSPSWLCRESPGRPACHLPVPALRKSWWQRPSRIPENLPDCPGNATQPSPGLLIRLLETNKSTCPADEKLSPRECPHHQRVKVAETQRQPRSWLTPRPRWACRVIPWLPVRSGNTMISSFQMEKWRL